MLENLKVPVASLIKALYALIKVDGAGGSTLIRASMRTLYPTLTIDMPCGQ